jgi:hypothetical protein
MWAWIVEHWEFSVGTLIGVLGLIVSVWAMFLRRPKRLDYEIVSDLQLINARVKYLDQLKVTYGGNPLEDPRIVVIRIHNTGKSAVTEDDFKGGEPISVFYEQNFYTSAELSAASLGTARSDIATIERKTVSGWIEGKTPPIELSIIPRLLNPGEWIELQLISDGPHGEISVYSRFAEQSRPMRTMNLYRRAAIARLLEPMAVIIVLGLVAIQFLWSPFDSWNETAGWVVIAGCLILLSVLGSRAYSEMKHL